MTKKQRNFRRYAKMMLFKDLYWCMGVSAHGFSADTISRWAKQVNREQHY